MRLQINQQLSDAYKPIVDALTFKQFGKTVGIRNYKAKALFIRDYVTKSKKVQDQCNKLIELYDVLITKAVSND